MPPHDLGGAPGQGQPLEGGPQRWYRGFEWSCGSADLVYRRRGPNPGTHGGLAYRRHEACSTCTTSAEGTWAAFTIAGRPRRPAGLVRFVRARGTPATANTCAVHPYIRRTYPNPMLMQAYALGESDMRHSHGWCGMELLRIGCVRRTQKTVQVFDWRPKVPPLVVVR